jgi:2-hydroxychromene-2-carboxylate isomerase
MHGDAPLRWYFDVISPFATLQWPKVKALATRREVVLVPVLLAAVLAARGQKGPAEIPGKREFTYRHVLWQARQAGVPLQFPPAHPFNPVTALRLCIAGGCTVAVVDAVFDWIWVRGRAGDNVEALQPLMHRLGADAVTRSRGEEHAARRYRCRARGRRVRRADAAGRRCAVLGQ